MRKLFKTLIILSLIMGISLVCLVYFFQIENVEIEGSNHYSDEEIKEKIFKDPIDNNALALYIKYKYFQDLDLAFIEKCHVEILDNNTVKIKIYEKRIIGSVEFMGDYLYFDKDGIVVESSKDKIEGVPLVKGLKYNEIILNEKLQVQNDQLYQTILNLVLDIEKYELQVESIVFNSGYEVRLDCGDSKILLGKKEIYDEEISQIKNILKETKGVALSIDMRNGDYIVAKPEKR